MTWPGLTQDVLNLDSLCYTCQVCQITKKDRKKYGAAPTQNSRI
jgi:hypothetical protein